MADHQTGTVDFAKLRETVKTAVRFQDNVIDATLYFFDKNERQAKGEKTCWTWHHGLSRSTDLL